MTKQELRLIDVKIHRTIFGFTDIRLLMATHTQDGCVLVNSVPPDADLSNAVFDWCYLPVYDHAEKGDIFCRLVPAYSTDIGAAWDVVAEVRKQLPYCYMEVLAMTKKNSTVAMYMARVAMMDDGFTFKKAHFYEADAPLAICRTALSALTE